MEQGPPQTRRRSLSLAAAALVAIAAHLLLSILYPLHQWITPAFWITLNALACAATFRYAHEAPACIRWRWHMFAISFLFYIASLFCILAAEYLPAWTQRANWLNDLLSAYRWLPLLLALCTPEELDQRENRVLDTVQTVLLAFIFLVLCSPLLLSQPDVLPPERHSILVNTYIYSQSIMIAVVALLAMFTTTLPASRFFYSGLTIYLVIGVPLSIWINHMFINVWGIAPSSPLLVLGDISACAYLFALPLVYGYTFSLPSLRALIFIRLGVPGFLPLFVLLGSMLVTIIGNRPLLGIFIGLLSLALYGLRSAWGQYRLLAARWDLESANESLQALSHRDPLTGLYNRRWFSEAIAHEWKLAQRYKTPFTLLLFDVDHFKLYNDTLGHIAGDHCLRAIADCVSAQLHRTTDSLVRYGGEEFVLILPDTDRQGASVIANRIMNALNECRLPHTASPGGIVTISIGGITSTGDDPQMTPETLLKLADAELYRAKHKGRNRISIASTPSDNPANFMLFEPAAD